MDKIATNILELVGKTPLVAIDRYKEALNIKNCLWAKLEYFNPAGSIKDRVGMAMIETAEKNGILHPGATIIEPTSGNTGIALAMTAAVKGYRVILTMPETMTVERRNLLKAYGAELVLTEGKKGMSGAIEKANQLKEEIKGAFIPSQFNNPSNPAVHEATTGPEIWEATQGKIDILIAGVGTGGTISGTGKFLKNKKPSLKVVAVEPFSSPVLSGGSAGPHGIQGIGAGFVPQILDTHIYDEIIKVKEEDAYSASKILAHKEGILVGISSGAVLWAAGQIAVKEENAGKNIVVILPDSGERYLSTGLFD